MSACSDDGEGLSGYINRRGINGLIARARALIVLCARVK